ncbi:mitochondrial 54S ribosomal protein YmL38/YmL34 [Microstroma glucosiphilum]|uniref:Large ribosomal subunit protein uL14m n=1 Tax=Pseudomicrostroma glucosiphilum TaxID=1684307 RepID=A0A316U6W4_9BASI|nr:mitochondrial 54S ribosomal protein YmL38/YmL34 [Pseudomicrostroma glucosiphilum]PWN20558.1 mitochondrial 54S ribosomal protein YmL38/YmL34 [Pseudomicrostroma glucosiphilum]
MTDKSAFWMSFPTLSLLTQIIDNSGGLVAECVNVLRKPTSRGLATVGDEIVVVIKKARPIPLSTSSSSTATKIRRGDVRHAVVVRTKKELQRPDGRVVRFDDNACVLLNNRKEPLGTRISGTVAAELRGRGWSKVLSLAAKVV